MNIVKGNILSREQSLTELDTLDRLVLETLSRERLDHRVVIEACDALSRRLSEEEHLPLLLSLGLNEDRARGQLAEAKTMLSRRYLHERLRVELGADIGSRRQYTPLDRTAPVQEQLLPLGVLLHIAAGNAPGLPVFSVLEGLLTGNINIL